MVLVGSRLEKMGQLDLDLFERKGQTRPTYDPVGRCRLRSITIITIPITITTHHHRHHY